ncbi:MAG: hypothetical protein Q7S83_01285 [bacterium]|nr:hypothetical protein [bacterium]
MKLPRASAGNLRAGFTIFESLIVISILVILFTSGLPVGLDFYYSSQFESEYNTLTSMFQLARNLAMANYNQSSFGISINSENFVIFQGASFAARTVSQDRSFPRAQSVTITGSNELVFTQLSGATASSTFNLSDGRLSRDLYVNSEGLVYEPSY